MTPEEHGVGLWDKDRWMGPPPDLFGFLAHKRRDTSIALIAT